MFGCDDEYYRADPASKDIDKPFCFVGLIVCGAVFATGFAVPENEEETVADVEKSR